MVTSRGGLTARVVTGAALIVVALVAVWFGEIAFTALVAAAVLLMFAEWTVMHGVSRVFRLVGLVALAGVVALAANGPGSQAVVVLAAAAGLLGLFARAYDRQRAVWLAAGLLYCGLPGIALIWLRRGMDGVGLVLWVLLIVWATDIAAYFVGRTIGGPKLAPAISPKKTVAGLVGGVVAAALASAVVGPKISISLLLAPSLELAVIGAGLAVVAQAGDLFESWLKRRAGVKDSGTLLPGHGGVLDRLDGLVPVAVIAALLVLLPV